MNDRPTVGAFQRVAPIYRFIVGSRGGRGGARRHADGADQQLEQLEAAEDT
jgi:hypothetical protein